MELRFSRRSLAISSVAVAAVLLAAGAWILFTFPPTVYSFYPKCAFRSMTGLECPGCGTTRALHHLLHGRVGEAFRLNPMLFAIAITAACALPSFLRGETPRFLMTRWFGWGSVTAVTGWWIVRNL